MHSVPPVFSHVATDWRRGDLLTFRKTGSSFLNHYSEQADGSAWDEVNIDGVRFRVGRAEGDGFADPRLKKLVEGDILPTVSRRDRRRNRALVWTSGNRVFGCDGVSVFTAILRAVQASEHATAAVQDLVPQPINDLQARLIQSTASQVKRIVRTEVREMMDFAQDTAVGEGMNDKWIDALKEHTRSHAFWGGYLKSLSATGSTPFSVHLAVFVGTVSEVHSRRQQDY